MTNEYFRNLLRIIYYLFTETFNINILKSKLYYILLKREYNGKKILI